MIRVVLNGEERELESGLTVSSLLDQLGLHPRLVVVEHNRHILDRAAFGDTEVRAGDSFELVHFVGGG